MPRKTEQPPAKRHGRDGGFNEAAARCRGKREPARPQLVPLPDASMRPRPDAAENQPDPPLPRAGFPASMRPRPDAAENAMQEMQQAADQTLQ